MPVLSVRSARRRPKRDVCVPAAHPATPCCYFFLPPPTGFRSAPGSGRTLPASSPRCLRASAREPCQPSGQRLRGLLVLARCGLHREIWADGRSAHLKRCFTGLAGDDVGHECPTSCPASVEQVQLTGMRPPVLAHVLSPAEPESRVCPHEDGPHLGKPAHRRTSNLSIGESSCCPRPSTVECRVVLTRQS